MSDVIITTGERELPGILSVPSDSVGVVVFAHGSGSSRLSPRNREVAGALSAMGLGTLLFDLLGTAEASDRRNVFDIGLLGERLVTAVDWLSETAIVSGPVGLFGASTGAAAALVAAATIPERIGAVVSRGGRPDLAGPALEHVVAPTLLIVGGRDYQVLELNRAAAAKMTCVAELEIVPDAGHLFEGRGFLESVAELAGDWFVTHLDR